MKINDGAFSTTPAAKVRTDAERRGQPTSPSDTLRAEASLELIRK